MVKIIKEGERPQDKIYHISCKNCNSKLEATGAEVTHAYGDQREPGHSVSVRCPYCSATARKEIRRPTTWDR